MNIGRHIKQPREVKDYPIDYTDWLAQIDPEDIVEDMVVVAVSNAAIPSDSSLLVDRVDIGSTGGAIWLSGGTANNTYKVEVLTSTVGGRRDEVEFTVSVKDF